MRDPDRIKRILNKLEIAWMAAPDLRFGQLVDNICFLYDKQQCPQFYLEDDRFEIALNKWQTKSGDYHDE